MPEYITVNFMSPDKWTGEYCMICSFRLTEEFPKDFPNKFKFCCTCNAIAYRMVNDELSLPVEDWVESRIKKIMKIITLVG